MNKSAQLIITAVILSCSVSFAGELPQISNGHSTITGGSPFAKASGDTIDLLGPTGSGAPYIGDFDAGWNGWTTIDLTQPTVHHWSVSTYNQSVPGNYAAWCGDISFASCIYDSLDAVGGYGNSWNEILAYRVSVAEPSLSALVTVRATLQYDTEPGYDFVYLSAKLYGDLGFTTIQRWSDAGAVAVNNSFTFQPSEYADGTDVYIAWRVASDGGWSDEDCSWPSDGACQIDDITVTTSQDGQSDIVSYTDFQSLPHSFGDWTVDLPTGVGNFGKLWRNLEDADPCATNYSQQVAFIDDGLVVPGTGGSDCINWCYGPGGYIVTTNGGLAGPAAHIQTELRSPVMAWPEDSYDGVVLAFDVYTHEILDADSPGIFYQWGIRSADTDGSAGEVQDIEAEFFEDRNFVYFGGPAYRRDTYVVSDLVGAGRDEVQVMLSVYQLGWAFGFQGDDGYPAPYFDNVSLKIFDFAGTIMVVRATELAQDDFLEMDVLPTANNAVVDASGLATMSVRLDIARNISSGGHFRNDPGDTIVLTVESMRAGAELIPPKMHYTFDANPVFAAVRPSGYAPTGVIDGVSELASDLPTAIVWTFDLPDTGFIFPGDVMHYYLRAGDDVEGDIFYSTVPVDLTGFGDFASGPLAYDPQFTFHALPSIRATATPDVYTQPKILFWNDNGIDDEDAEWYSAFAQLGLVAGVDYDIYCTNSPRSGVGNGLGGRTGGLALEDYQVLVYSSGTLGTATISNGDFQHDPGDDITALLVWLSAGNKSMYLTGDSLASDLGNNAGGAGLGFLESVMGLDLTGNELRGFIENQVAPLVVTAPGNSVFLNIDSWLAYGGCPSLNRFDAVTSRPGAEKLAEFANSSGAGGAYPYAAMTKNLHLSTNRIISQPYDFGSISIDQNAPTAGAYQGRVQVLADVLDHFGFIASGEPSGVAAITPALFSVDNFPNPFNPSTKISYTVKAAGHLSIKIYNIRGELVRTLVDGQVDTSSFVIWDGTNNQGGNVSSGVYFYEARMGGEVEVNKLALVK